jgi:hypothetical protein
VTRIVRTVRRRKRSPKAQAAAIEGSAIVTSISRKEARLRRMAEAREDAAIEDTDEALTARFTALIADKLRKRPDGGR